jgi:hypothetical protein
MCTCLCPLLCTWLVSSAVYLADVLCCVPGWCPLLCTWLVSSTLYLAGVDGALALTLSGVEDMGDPNLLQVEGILGGAPATRYGSLAV